MLGVRGIIDIVHSRSFTSLSIALNGGEPPSEFCIFTAGVVDTSKGTFVFDEAAAASVMAEYAKQGNELMIDYDHASLASLAIDPALAGKAAGWFSLEVRNGELWAVNVRWTLPAATALRAKEWRYMSPAFETVEGHVTSLLNVAITNLPATRKLQPLMAASLIALGEDTKMDPEQVKAALEALVAGDEAKCAEILKAMIAAAASGEAPAADAPADAPAGDVAAAEDAPPPASDEKKKEDPAAVAASIARFMRLSGKSSFVAAVAEIEVWRASHLELETERQALAKERGTLEAAERRRGCVDLVKLGGRAPATVWADDKCSAPKKYLAAMPIADFRDYVADALSAKGTKVPTPPRAGAKAPVADDSVDEHGLTARERQICKEQKCDPATFATLKARGTKS